MKEELPQGTPLCLALEPVISEKGNIFDGVRLYGQMPAQFKCNCSRERVEKALIALGRAELSNIIADGKPETLNCSFCNTNYTFTVDEMKEILAKCTH